MGGSARTSAKLGDLLGVPERGDERQQVGEDLEALQPRRPAELWEPRTGLQVPEQPGRTEPPGTRRGWPAGHTRRFERSATRFLASDRPPIR